MWYGNLIPDEMGMSYLMEWASCTRAHKQQPTNNENVIALTWLSIGISKLEHLIYLGLFAKDKLNIFIYN